MTALLIVSLVTIATAVKKINVASQIIAEASSAVGQMKAMMLYPMLPVTLISIVFVWFLYVGKFSAVFCVSYAMQNVLSSCLPVRLSSCCFIRPI